MIKRYIAFLLTTALVFSTLCACNSTSPSAADTYLSMAEDFIKQDNRDAAMEILQKGFTETKDERIAVMMAELASENADASNHTNDNTDTQAAADTTHVETDSLHKYIGIWAEDEIGWEYGGLILDINDVIDGSVDLTLSFTQAAPESRVAEFDLSIPLEELNDNVLSASFENDGWDNKGDFTLEFNDEEITCLISNVEYTGDDLPTWGFFDESYSLIKNENAHELMEYTEDEYYELYPEEQADESSGNMTIEEMKKNCRILKWEPDDISLYTTISYVAAYDMGNNPNYVNQCFVPCQMQTFFTVCPKCLGTGYINENECHNTGHDYTDKTEDNVHYILQADSNKAVLRPISIDSVVTTPNGNIVYKAHTNYFERQEINIYDARQDQSVIINEETNFVPYLIYLGEVDDILEFSMFACDIVN